MTGIVLIDKPADWTSHDVVAKLRGLFHERRIGHAGTLDPMATGLLTVFVGRATRAAEFAEADDKTYIARIRFGETTDTQDSTGNVLTRCDARVTREELETAALRFTGEIEQIPPMYSAVKVEGQRLYKLARRGVEIERKPRRVTIHTLRVIGEAPGEFILEITCSKGTYIRTLCHDLGQALGCGAVMSGLRRTGAGAFRVEDAVTLEEIGNREDRAGFLRPVDTLFHTLPALSIGPVEEVRLRNGQTLSPVAPSPGRYRVYGEGGEFLALAEADRAGGLDVIKRFFAPR